MPAPASHTSRARAADSWAEAALANRDFGHRRPWDTALTGGLSGRGRLEPVGGLCSKTEALLQTRVDALIGPKAQEPALRELSAQFDTRKPLRVVADQVFAPTFASELAEALIALARRGARGLVHVTNEGTCSWHELATAALEAAGLARPVEAITAESLNLPARRPAYSVLDTSRYRSLGLPPLRHWRQALPDLLS